MVRSLLLGVLVVACSSNQAKPEDAALENRMLDHFFALTTLERAVIRGDLREASEQARALATPRPDDPASWAPYTARLQAAARATGAAASVPEAAHGVSEILQSCYSCHRELGVEFKPVSIPEPPAGDSIAAKMQRHQWGVDLLRVALVFGDDAVWDRGASVLTSAPLDPAELAESGRINPETIGYARQLRGLAASAKQVEGAARFRTYDDLLSTCVGCHSEPGGH